MEFPTHLWLSDAKWLHVASTVLVILVCIGFYRKTRRATPQLLGPPSQSFLFGVEKSLLPSPDITDIFQDWEQEFGPVYQIPTTFGSRHIVLADPKAIAHVFANDTTKYRQPTFSATLGRKILGNILSAVEGEDHKRQRRVLSSAFSVSAIRDLHPIFLDSGHQIKSGWDSILLSCSDDSNKGAIIDVMDWMDRAAIDTIGKAGFAHDFGDLRAQSPSQIREIFASFHKVKPSLAATLAFLIGPLFPKLLTCVPGPQFGAFWKIADTLKPLAVELYNRASSEINHEDIDRSILGVVVRSENAGSNLRLTVEEITAQNLFVLAGFQTTSITLTWGFVELCRHPEIQETLRAELRNTLDVGQDPTYDQLANQLPHLDAFVCEILRFHPAEVQIQREVNEDDVISLTHPIQTASGTIDSLFVTRDTVIRLPLGSVNRSKALWGPDAGIFNPSRWLLEHDTVLRKEEVKGFRNLLTFASGPRMCPGRNFVVSEIKAALAILIYNFAFEFVDGPCTKIGNHLLRPKLADEKEVRLPILVRKVV